MSDIEERTVNGLNVRIKRDTCAAFKACESIAPEVFHLGEDNVITFKETIGEIDRERLLEACRACPVNALQVIDANGETLVG